MKIGGAYDKFPDFFRMGTFIDNHHHHHHVALLARISLTLSRHSSLSFIALGRSSGQHPVSSHSCWMYVRAGRPAFARPCVRVHKSTSLMSSSLLIQQCPTCLVRLTWIVFVIGGRCRTVGVLWGHTWNSSPLRSNLLRLQCTCCTVPTTSGRPHGSPLVWVCQWPLSQTLSSPQLSHNDSLWA